jgi:hypothetical protein
LKSKKFEQERNAQLQQPQKKKEVDALRFFQQQIARGNSQCNKSSSSDE